MTKHQIELRNKNIIYSAIYDSGVTLAEIGTKYGLTRQRVSKILKEQGIDRQIVNERKANDEKAYQEALRAARKSYATVLPNGKQRPEYRVYANMLRRCLSSKCRVYKRYGGRGISVCAKWRGPCGFESFLMDMGPRPEGKYPSGRAKYSIHRIDGDGNDEPINCKWATQKEQCSNRHKPQRDEKASGATVLGVNNTDSSTGSAT